MGAMETDCEKCLHQKVCALWRAHESQDASCFSLDGCDYFDATLTPPNEWVNRVRELDELYTKLQIVTGFTAEQLLEIFAAGYTLEKPDYSKKFPEMENLAEAAQPNEPLTMEELRESPHGKIKNSTLQSICNRANEIASRPPEVSP